MTVTNSKNTHTDEPKLGNWTGIKNLSVDEVLLKKSGKGLQASGDTDLGRNGLKYKRAL
jgi:hypothetical protein